MTSSSDEYRTVMSKQVGGDHYKNMKIQPAKFIVSNGIEFLEGNVIKRMCRHDKVGGQGEIDLRKAIHEIQILIIEKYSDTGRNPVLGGAV